MAGKALSICIPTYQMGPYVATAVESALRQTTPALEVVVSDNWSTDETPQVLERFRGRIRIVRPPAHTDAYGSYMYVMQQARGDYVVGLSADDALHPRFVESVTPYLGGYAMVTTGRFDCDGRLTPLRYRGLSHLWKRKAAPGELFSYFVDRCAFSMPGTAWEREWVLNLPRLPAEAAAANDWYLIMLTSASKPIARLAAPLHYYRLHGANLSHGDPARWRKHAAAAFRFVLGTGLLSRPQAEEVEQKFRTFELETAAGPPPLPESGIVIRALQKTMFRLALWTYGRPTQSAAV